MNGGAGADTFVFNAALGAGNVDEILDFANGVDLIRRDPSVFAALGAGPLDANAFVIGTAALDGDDRIIYNSTTGGLFYDADGDGAGAAIQFATLTGAPTLIADDFIIGG
jgi:serralysin